jgi:hypothetical protein
LLQRWKLDAADLPAREDFGPIRKIKVPEVKREEVKVPKAPKVYEPEVVEPKFELTRELVEFKPEIKIPEISDIPLLEPLPKPEIGKRQRLVIDGLALGPRIEQPIVVPEILDTPSDLSSFYFGPTEGRATQDFQYPAPPEPDPLIKEVVKAEVESNSEEEAEANIAKALLARRKLLSKRMF